MFRSKECDSRHSSSTWLWSALKQLGALVYFQEDIPRQVLEAKLVARY